MDPAIQAKVLKGQRKVQALWGEQLILGPLTPIPPPPITALLSRETLTQRFVEGKGMDEVWQMTASVARSDISSVPFTGQQAQARNRSWRVWIVSPTQTTWELTLESPKK